MEGSPSAPPRALRWLRAPFITTKPLSHRHPLDVAWMFAARVAGRILAAYLKRGFRGAAAYLRGSIAGDDGVYGFSDLDMVLVLPDHPVHLGEGRALAARRWQALQDAMPRIARNVDVAIYEETELERAVWSPCLRCRPGRDDRPAWRLDLSLADGDQRQRPTVAEISSVFKRFCIRPDLYRPMQGWKLLAGRERRPAVPHRDRADHWISAWHELQWWWGYAFVACLNLNAAYLPSLSSKLIVEPARTWLWIVHGEWPGSRREVLETAIDRLPEEEPLLRWALGLPRLAPSGTEETTLAVALAGLVRLSTRLAQALVEDVAPLGSTRVQLHGSAATAPHEALPPSLARLGEEPLVFPLVDWRARAAPIVPEESLALCDADPADPAALAIAATASSRTLYPALRTDRLLVLPVADQDQTKLRGVQCAVTDPVSFAVAEGATTASFPNVAGWSALDSARRAVAEHAAWLDDDRGSPYGAPRLELAMLLTAARAALFLESVEAESPELAVTLEAVVERLGARDARAREIGPEALAAWRSPRGRPDDPALVNELRRVVGALLGQFAE